MGFTTGLLGGFTLTTTLLYLSLNIHNRNRIHQSAHLRQQALVLNSFVDPPKAATVTTSREVRGGVLETVKDTWNAELESNLRKIYQTDWDAVRDRAEDIMRNMWGRST